MRTGPLLKVPDEYTSSEKEAILLLFSTHFPGSSVVAFHIDDVSQPSVFETTSWKFAFGVLTNDNLAWATNSFEKYKSPGLDGIYPVFVQKELDLVMPHMMQLYRSVITLGYIPRCWRDSRVVFIAKPGRPSYQEPKAFRSICLSSFFLKNLERIIDAYIRENSLTNYPLHVYQPCLSTY